MLSIKTRMQAADAGEKKYYTGRPCSKGHDAPRYTSTGGCTKCTKMYTDNTLSRLRKLSTARAAGLFTYPSHPGDVAAALAYCQALDMQRGRVPHFPAPPQAPAPFDAEEARRLAFGKVYDR